MTLNVTPIGTFKCNKNSPAETSSQGPLDQSNEIGCIELLKGHNFEQALTGLSDMSHVWVTFWFHQKQNWKPMVQVPRGSLAKQGVFATRSPHRPNPIGLSLLEIVEIKNLKIFVRKFDLLNETPILDLKPFHPEADRALDPRLGWMENLQQDEYEIQPSEFFTQQFEFVSALGVTELLPFALQQLRFDPFNWKKKRVVLHESQTGTLAYRTWRIDFSWKEAHIRLDKIRSGYSEKDLSDAQDKWQDKKIHLEFKSFFGR